MLYANKATFFCGPYKGTCRIQDDGSWRGRIDVIRDVVVFEGRTLTEARDAFVAALEGYLAPRRD